MYFAGWIKGITTIFYKNHSLVDDTCIREKTEYMIEVIARQLLRQGVDVKRVSYLTNMPLSKVTMLQRKSTYQYVPYKNAGFVH